ncbi:MAG: DNA repair protein RecN [Clostridia bacterium]|nr:DNA repair protein RecN [Clostridia bacterium]
MLKYLHIENIAVIEKTSIEFLSGFNVLTGETGSGKSIIIDAINAILGERTSKELIRNGCDKAYVSALFGDLSKQSKNLLVENGYETDSDGNLLITRTLSLTGNGMIKINGKPVTATVLKALSKSLVNIHGQHDNQGLMNPDNHYLYIDLIAENVNELNDYYLEFKKLNSIRRELNALYTDEDEKRRKIELLKYEIDELISADIKVGEIAELKKQLDISLNYQKMLSSLNEAYKYLNGTESVDGAISLITNSKKSLASVKTQDFDEAVYGLESISAQLDDVCTIIRRFTENQSFSELNHEKISERLDLLRKLMLKYGNTEERMLEYLERSQKELEDINLSDKKIIELSDELDSSTERLVALADKLTLSRKKASEKFACEVTEILKYLDMPNVKFEVKFEKGRYTKTGCDNIEFMICTNLGEDTKPLYKIASGGELSRIMLSIKSVLSSKDDVDTLIFDEIDSGISGRAAGKVGVQLNKVASARQVICVTHLAQIAAKANNHLLIEKHIENTRTNTSVKSLSYEERINELARIMSGTDMTEKLYDSAKELLDGSLKNGNL